MNGRNRSDIVIGLKVSVIQKADQRSGKRTDGVVAAILTNSSFHPHGIKVRLADGTVGRVTSITES
ncbi:MAG: YwbE family protein [Methanocalculus sp.]|uniref:YwbE family protein n=1 Tax=Methanocalculus sp. TaxID=2004547 RepID=UPI0027165E72|nr:YwbE family protein [Methanocalculus sp.]MDO9539557.1 YwbE family protein [Methanocalculus sp.]